MANIKDAIRLHIEDRIVRKTNNYRQTEGGITTSHALDPEKKMKIPTKQHDSRQQVEGQADTLEVPKISSRLDISPAYIC